MRRRDLLKSAGALGLTLPLGAAGGAKRALWAPERPLRGMTVSCPTWGPIWGSPLMGSCLAELRDLGVEWVAIHPYAGVKRNGAIRWSPARESAFLARAVDYASASGMKLFWKPHLAYWGSFSWRGEISFDDEAAWKRFFTGYRGFIVDQARFAAEHKVPLFCVGLEYEKTVHRREWRDVIRAVRDVYSGPLTYGANWDGTHRVPFWEDLDTIGVQAYFPVGDASKTAPSREGLKAAWAQHLARLRGLSRGHGGCRVLFTELGYPRSLAAAYEPWKPGVDERPAALALRERLMDAALESLAPEPTVAGVFWWKWMPGPALYDRDFSMKDEEARRVLKKHWAPG